MFFYRGQQSTHHIVHFVHPRNPGVLNVIINKKEEDDNSIVVSDVTEEHLEAKTREVADLHAEVRVKWQCMHLKNYNINMFERTIKL